MGKKKGTRYKILVKMEEKMSNRLVPLSRKVSSPIVISGDHLMFVYYHVGHFLKISLE